ncbi:TonB-dependent receptor [Mannheimia sp. AT1]|uniref:TonB-dependent receptor n=1 Tax=Mannheimia cairinae TaxID=3025936 RepID=A0ABT5MRA7_9PAST|nr:TonB-dependent receptor [Mannheimia cairinae]MDD0824503.1 TonB-dependent receptor [Mannheimia cairinae]MDD0825604.1 TonB-dependent receptor [Mannheimia cairinae]
MQYPFKLSLLAVSLISVYGYADEQLNLDTIDVVASKFAEKDKVFVKTNANSTRENIALSNQQLDNIVRSVPGAFTQMDKSQGTVSINIRGGSGFGRANTMIDGVPQTFYASSADGGGRAGGTSQFGTMIDPSFVSSLDVERGTFSGGSGANTLMGSANFKTIGVDDVLEKGKNVGAMTKIQFGTNAIGPNYMGAVAGKASFENERSLGFLYGYSWRKISQDYKIGGGRRVTESSIDLNNPDYIEDEYDIANTTTSPFNAENLKQKPQSHLGKIEYNDQYQNLTLGYRKYASEVAQRKLKNDTYQVNYNFKLPDTNWLDLGVLYARTQGIQQYDKGVKIFGKSLKEDLETRNNTSVFDIHNTFHLPFLFNSDLDLTFGYNRLSTKFDKNRHPAEININLEEDETNEDNNCYGLNCVRKSLYTSTFQADGKQKFDTFYLDSALTYNIFALDASVNLVKSKHQGKSFRYLPHYIQEIENGKYRLRKNNDQIALAELDSKLTALGKQHNCDYDAEYDEYECPDINIPFDHHGKKKKVNYSVTLSANMNDLFTPFVSYSKTHRLPNINEMFFSSLGHYGVNTNLNSEQARTLQIGFNGFKENLFSSNDKLGFKALAYKTNIQDYIFNVQRFSYDGNGPYIYHRNRAEEKVKMKGFELELSYDMGRFYANLAYARQLTNQPASYTDASSRVDTGSDYARTRQGFGLSKISILPNSYASLDIGTRWFDEKLIIGGIGKYFGKSKRASINEKPIVGEDTRLIENQREIEDIPKQPIIFDFYVSYEPIKNLVIKGEIQNIFDKKYIDPLDANNDSANQTIFNLDLSDKDITVLNNFARGRTYVMSLNYKF